MRGERKEAGEEGRKNENKMRICRSEGGRDKRDRETMRRTIQTQGRGREEGRQEGGEC